jgi:hypothetical protein
VLPVELTEKEWQAQVLQLAKLCGWKKAFHVYDSRRSHTGWPDLVLVRERLVFAELKTETGKVSPAQWEWLDALGYAGAEVYVWRPSDLEQVAATLRRRAQNGVNAPVSPP